MNHQPIVFAVVPFFNESPNIPRLLEGLRDLAGRHRLRCVLVDDGSRDDSRDAIARERGSLDVCVLTHPTTRGPGAAFGTAFEHLARVVRPSDWVVTMEADNTSRLDILEQMLKRTEEGYDVVLASPYAHHGAISNTPLVRVIVSHIANGFVKEALGIRGLLTMSSFYRLYRGAVLLRLQERHGPRVIERPGFECMVELLLKLIFANARISEVPMALDTSLRAGKSKMKIARTALGYLDLWRHKRRWKRESDAPR